MRTSVMLGYWTRLLQSVSERDETEMSVLETTEAGNC